MRKKLLFGFILLLITINFIYIFSTNLLPKPLAILLAYTSNEIKEIESVTKTTTGPIYRCISGNDKNGNKKVIWIDTKIVKSIYLKSGISKKEACEIAEKEGLANWDEVQLVYIPSLQEGTISKVIPEGVYWFIVDENNKYIFINFNSGEIQDYEYVE